MTEWKVFSVCIKDAAYSITTMCPVARPGPRPFHLFHVMARGNDGQKKFLGESDYQGFLEALRTVRQRYSAEILLRKGRLGMW